MGAIKNMMKDAFGFGVTKQERDPQTLYIGLEKDIDSKKRQRKYIPSGNYTDFNGKQMPTSVQNPDYVPYSKENPWYYDKKINLDAEDKGREARDYLSKNLPYISGDWDNTEFESEFTNAFVEKHGLKAWKQAVDGIINEYNPMNAYDLEGNPMNVFGSADAWDYIEQKFPTHTKGEG